MRAFQQPTTVGILVADMLVEDSLVWLLQKEGYDARKLGTYPTDS